MSPLCLVPLTGSPGEQGAAVSPKGCLVRVNLREYAGKKVAQISMERC